MKRTNNSDYWQNRFEALEDTTYRQSETFIINLSKQYDRASQQLKKDVGYWLGRLAENNEVSLAQARKYLEGNELEEFHWNVEEYIKHGRENALNQKWIKELENASAKVHISRLEQIQTEMRQVVESLYHEFGQRLEKHLAESYSDNYYRTAYELAKGTGVTTSLHTLDRASVLRLVNKPWCADGKAFSERIWARRNALVSNLNTALTQNIVTGKDPRKTINDIAKKFGVEKSAAGRLVLTESAALGSEARQNCMHDLGVEEFEYVATLDSHTSEICRSMDGQHFPMSQFKVGLNAPPLHCNCRSCTVPYFNDEFTQDEYRAARDINDEGYKTVPSDIKYQDWKDTYVDPGPKESAKNQKPNTREYINVAEVKKQNKSAGEQLEMLPQSHIDLLNEQNTQILFDFPEFSNYNEVDKTIHLLDDLSDQELIHEVGHALEDKLQVWSDKVFLEIAKKVAENNACYYDPDTFVKPVWRIDSPLLISEYQGRVYDFPGSILEDGTANPIALGDLFSEAYAYYITTPLELKKCNSELYEYLRKVLPI